MFTYTNREDLSSPILELTRTFNCTRSIPYSIPGMRMKHEKILAGLYERWL